MSINSAMLAGVSGLVANSAALAAISDNIANVNTVGYKKSEVDFQDIVTSSASKGAYNAGGVLGTTRQLVTQQGDFTQTSSSTDLAISGQGMFVVTNKSEANLATDARSFTRAGAFTPDAQGYLKNAAGLYLQGWLVDDNGVINTDPSDLSKLSSINISSYGGTADPTTRVTVNANLNSGQPTSAAAAAAGTTPAGAGAYVPGTNDMAMYEASGGATGVAPDYKVEVPASDSKGGQRTLQISFLKSSTPNQWYAQVMAVPASDVNKPNGLIASGKVAFTTDGKLDTAKTTLPMSLAFAASGSGSTGVQWADALGISAQTIALDLDQAPGGLTQAASKSVIQSITTNGTMFGNLEGISIDNDGYVTARYDNGVTRQIAQVAIATFPNADGLKAISGNAYQVSLESGTYNLKAPGSGGAGTLTPSTLEASTVDLSAEFTGLITTQRAYSASSKIITTADQMLQELIDIKR